jgi:hypothetical protein
MAETRPGDIGVNMPLGGSVELDVVLLTYVCDETIRLDSAINQVLLAMDIEIRLEGMILGCHFSIAMQKPRRPNICLSSFWTPL